MAAGKVVIIAALLVGGCDASRHKGEPADSDEDRWRAREPPSSVPDPAVESGEDDMPFSPPLVANVAKRTVSGAVLDLPSPSGHGWDGKCRINRPSCDPRTAPLPACSKALSAMPWSVLQRSLPPGSVSFESRVVTVRGRLKALGGFWTTHGRCGGPCAAPANCPAYCCNITSSPVLLTGGTEALVLSGFECSGDDSRRCCNAPAYGQSVIATGRLSRAFSMGAHLQWELEDPKLCLPADAG